ncbi:hypothetical protein U14_01638 [Candidatus Moduliflexus flocculans]|uniref:PA14 domain-containing protein n=1 Tax=Candidatus Moduliflexus flocculans TaxID=1499966 RepID=A0A0S6VSR9_9BACT|nr:hypothetical protein U14_01638 [Candidatus Moduliflexus flocculans]
MIVRETTLNLSRMQAYHPDIPERYSVRWTGYVVIPNNGEYQFSTASDDGSQLWLDEQLVVDNSGTHGLEERTGTIALEKGVHALRIDYSQETGGAEFRAFWMPPKQKRQSLSTALLLTRQPSPVEFVVGRICNAIVILGKLFGLITLTFAGMLLLFNRAWLWSFSKNAPPIRAARQLLRPDVPAIASPEPPSYSRWPLLAAFIAFLLLSLVWTHPFITQFSTKMFGIGGDRYIHLWNMWWMNKALVELHVNPLTTDYLFQPAGIDLSFHDYSLFNALLSVPLQRFLTLTEIYNLLMLASFVVGGFGCVLLLRYLTGSTLAGVISGLIFAFWGGRAYYVDHLSLMSMQWFPYCALYLIKTVRERSYRAPLLAALFFIINALTAWYYAIYMSLFAALYLLYAALAERKQVWTLAFLKRFALFAGTFLLIMLPILLPMFKQIAGGGDYMISEVYKTDAVSLNTLLLPSVNHDVLGKYMRRWYINHNHPMQWGIPGGSFLGYATMLLCLYTLLKLRRLKPHFWLFAFAVFLILAMGPNVMLFSAIYESLPLPYQLLQKLPLLNIIRIPVRFMALVMLSCGVLAGYACWDIFRRVRFKFVLFLAFAAIILFEQYREYYFSAPEPVPDFYQQLAQDTDDYAILELTPLFNWQHSSLRSSLFQITHQKKLFHGHVSRVPWEKYQQAYALYAIFDDLLTLSQTEREVCAAEQATAPYFLTVADAAEIFDILRLYNVRYVALYNDYWYGSYHKNQQRLQQIFGKPTSTSPLVTFYRVPPAAPTKTLIFPALGMFPLTFSKAGIPERQLAPEAELIVWNLEQANAIELRFDAIRSQQPEEPFEVTLNGEPLGKGIATAEWNVVQLSAGILRHGKNGIRIKTAANGSHKYGIRVRNIEVKLSNENHS